MRKFIFILIFLHLVFAIFADLGDIIAITNPEMVFNFDLAIGPVSRYQDRLYVGNGSKTQELLILPDGQLEFISYFDQSSNHNMVSGNRLIIPNREPNRGFSLLDISVSPMELITYVNLWGIANISTWRNHVFFTEDYIMIQSQIENIVHLINKETGIYEGDIPGMATGGFFSEVTEDIFIRISQITNGLLLQVFSFEGGNSFTEISSRNILNYGTSWTQINVEDSKIIIATEACLVIYDIGNPLSPTIEDTIWLTPALLCFLYDGSFIYVFDLMNNLKVYEQNNQGIYQLIHTQTLQGIRTANAPYSLLINSGYLYLNGQIALFVFDTNNNYQIVNRWGIVTDLPLISVSNNDVYYVECDIFNATQSIYSVLNNSLIATLNYSFMGIEHFLPIWTASYMHFQIVDDRLYVYYRDPNNTGKFDIYFLEEWPEATLLNSITIPNATNIHNFNVTGNRLFLTDINTLVTSVYELNNDNIIFLVSFPGRIQYPLASQPTDFVLNINNNSLYIRDLETPSNILFSSQIANLVSDSQINFIDDNHFTFFYNSGYYYSYIASFDINNNNHNILSSQYLKQLKTLNRVITAHENEGGVLNISNFYTIRDNEVAMIGTMDYGDRWIMVNYTYFFPEIGKKVLVTRGGIWTYDVEFENVSENDKPIPIAKTELLGNYPNPFNPTTTIKLSLKHASHLRVDIYNIKGQKVKSLLNEYRSAGDHKIVWDGKDEKGNDVGNGIYFYKMETEGYVETKKMVLMK